MSAQANRLEKLLKLLNEGKVIAIKTAAAEQVADLVRSKPTLAPLVFSKVQILLYNKDWDTRVAASRCISLLAQHIRHFRPADLAACISADHRRHDPAADAPKSFPLDGFELATLLQNGSLLLESSGQAYDPPAGQLSTEELAKQKGALKARLGIKGAMSSIMDTDDLVDESDLQVKHSSNAKEEKKAEASSLLSKMQGMSARERIQLKRKLKTTASKPSTGSKKRKVEGDTASDKANGQPNVAQEPDAFSWESLTSGSWPFQRLADCLVVDCLHQDWETRHGGSLGLRELLSIQADCAAITAPIADPDSGWAKDKGAGTLKLAEPSRKDVEEATVSNRCWLEDCIMHLLCVLALDRFADFVSDQVVAPVRETAAQALGFASRPLPPSCILKLADSLKELTSHENWNVRHAGLLGIKYLLAARLDLCQSLLEQLMPAIIAALKDDADDVKATAAEALLPAVSSLGTWPADKLEAMKTSLWDILSKSDDLSLAPGSVMGLLARLYSSQVLNSASDLADVASWLLPYFRHSLTTVRHKAVVCLHAMLSIDQAEQHWLTQAVLEKVLPVVFLNLVLEGATHILELSKDTFQLLVSKTSPEILARVMTPGRIQASVSLAVSLEGIDYQQAQTLLSSAGSKLAACYHNAKFPEDHDKTGMQIACSTALACLVGAVPPDTAGSFFDVIIARLSSGESSIARRFAALVCAYTCKPSSESDSSSKRVKLPASVHAALQKVLSAVPATRGASGQLHVYRELAAHYRRVQNTGLRLLKQCLAGGRDLSQILVNLPAEQYMRMLTADNMSKMVGMVDPGQDAAQVAAKEEFQAEIQALTDEETQLHNQVKALSAAALIHDEVLPARLNLVIQPLMATLRKEDDSLIRQEIAAALAALLHTCHGRTPSPNAKIIGNLATLLAKNVPVKDSTDDNVDGSGKQAARKVNAKLDAAVVLPIHAPNEQAADSSAYEGAKCAFVAIANCFGPALCEQLPSFQKLIETSLSTAEGEQTVLQGLLVLAVTAPHMPPELDAKLLQWICLVVPFLANSAAPVRTTAAICAASMLKNRLHAVMPTALGLISSLMADPGNPDSRQGFTDFVAELSQQLDHLVVPYLYLVMVPIMRIMNSQHQSQRSSAAPVFAKLVAFLPLAEAVPMPEGLSQPQQEEWINNRQLLNQLLDSSKVPDFAPSFKIKGELRQYQKNGVSWMNFLDRCGLHGILADDMGLGKTLQATLVLAESHTRAKATGEACKASLVVCPQILVGHWALEINKFVDKDVLQPLAYEGSRTQRLSLQDCFASVDVVIMSYETLRSDSATILQSQWNYCILDEGHVIRNSKAKISQAVREVRCEHRLILSGTPIQNNVQELWALFNFLMPGFLGTEAAFNSKYGKALLAGRTAKSGSLESQKALLAMDGLHKQVAPFILRRTKDTVLQDLPPKIIQDIYCDLSPLQAALYADFAVSSSAHQIQASVDTLASSGSPQESAPHIFQALQYMRKLCSHPLMVLDEASQKHREALLQHTNTKSWQDAQRSVHDLQQAPKLQALQQLLQQCGIGEPTEDGMTDVQDGPPLHRVLVFAQYKSLLDIVETDVMKPLSIPFLRLDGSVEASRRFPIVQQFNEDSSIPVMLLTTGVGGLGLNLTSADTVIFLEHDWNPMKDLQAMDRAHRLGQKQTVNVYRLLMKDSLEERVLGLQRFKIDVANAVINEENATGGSLLSGAVLDLLGKTDSPAVGDSTEKASGLKSMLDGLGALWEEQQYTDEFSIDNFQNKLK